jgi:ClpP class serine protease
MSVNSVKFDEGVRHAVYGRDEYKCAYCGYHDKTGSGANLSLDHIKSLDHGGDSQHKRTDGDRRSNVVTACGSCNSSKQELSPKAFNIQRAAAGKPPVDFAAVRAQTKKKINLKQGDKDAKIAKAYREASSYLDFTKLEAGAGKGSGPGVQHDPSNGQFAPGNARGPPQRRMVKPGEMLALSPGALHTDGSTGAVFWMLGSGIKPNERRGDTALVYIRGELEHHADTWGSAESYEGIVQKVTAAATGQDVLDAHRVAYLRDHYGDAADYVAPRGEPPKRVVACIDSPGGVVSGLNECVAAIQRLVAAHPEVEFAAFVDEMAASAAFALACAFPEIICPRSAILGSIGVISTMISQARKNAKDGFDVRLITSGARKADGHLHAPISDAAVAAETGRVNKLATSFWRLAAKARGLPVARIQSFEAGIFLGPDAVKRGLADAIMSFDAVLLGGGGGDTSGKPAPLAGGNETDRRVTEPTMSIALKALVKKTETKIAAEKDPEKLSKLYADLSAYKKTVKHMEHETREEDDDEKDDDEKDEGEEDDDESEEEAKAAKAKDSEPPMKGKASSEDDESEEEEAKAALAAVRAATGLKGKAARGALAALAALPATLARDVEALKKQTSTDTKTRLIEAALAGKQITRAEAKDLRAADLPFVDGFLAMRKKAGFVVTDEGALEKPKHVQPGSAESLPETTRAMVDLAVSSSGLQGEAAFALRATLVKAHLASHAEQLKAAGNGAPGRY